MFVALLEADKWAWGLVLGIGLDGAALSIGMSYGLSVILLGLYSKTCEHTTIILRRNAIRSITQFFFLVILFGLIFCWERWTFELLIILAGLSSVLLIWLHIYTTHYFIHYGVSATISTPVSLSFVSRIMYSHMRYSIISDLGDKVHFNGGGNVTNKNGPSGPTHKKRDYNQLRAHECC